MKVTQEQCERAVEAIKESGFNASYIQSEPGDHGVWIDSVWDNDLQNATSFRIHDEEIEWWQTQDK